MKNASLIAGVAGLLLIQATSVRAQTVAASSSVAAQGPDIVVTARASNECPDLLGADALSISLKDRDIRFVVVGEYHGTSETPTLFRDLICYVSKINKVNVLLEINEIYQHDLDKFFQSSEQDKGIKDLLATPGWNQYSQDGRTSLAMLELLKYLRSLRRRSPSVKVYAAQPDKPTRLVDQGYAEFAMANKWVSVADEDPNSINFILVGNLQASKSFDEERGFIPAAGHIPSKDIVSFAPESQGGSAWSCRGPTMDCGPHPVPGRGLKPRYISLYPQTINGYDGSYSVGSKFSPSPPAVMHDSNQP